MERKTIILLATSDINYDQRLQKVAHSLSQLNNDVHLIGRSLKSSVTLTPKDFQQTRLNCIFNSGVLFYLEINIRFFFFLIRKPIDTLCVNDVDTALAGLWLSWFKNIDLVFDAHEYFTEVPELQGKKVKQKIWQFLKKQIIKKSKKRYTVNNSLAKLFEEKYHKPFQVVSNAPILESEEIIYEKENYILYQGALNKGRGLFELIQAMPQINMPVKIAGKGDEEQELKQLVKELNLENKVTFLGNLKPEELKLETQKAKIGLNLLSATSLNYYYSLANKFFDYMHANTPQICMNFPEYKTINKQFEIAILIDDLSTKSISDSINTLIQNESNYQTLQANCMKAKDVYNWQKSIKTLAEIYA